MKKFILTVIALAVFSAVPVYSQTAEAKPKTNDLGWLAGCWEVSVRNGATVVSEQWMKPAGGTMIGMGRTLSGGKTTGWEFIRIVAEGDGLNYIAKPSANKDETVFKLAKSSADEFVFENPAHDFPQKITYRKAGPDALFTRVEGTRNGRRSGTDVQMKRVKCEL